MTFLEIIYVIIAALIWGLGFLHTGRFVRPKWKIPGKFIFYIGISWLLVHWLGHWGLVFIISHPLIGFIFHLRICRKHSIHWLTCEPQSKYLALQEKWARGEFL